MKQFKEVEEVNPLQHLDDEINDEDDDELEVEDKPTGLEFADDEGDEEDDDEVDPDDDSGDDDSDGDDDSADAPEAIGMDLLIQAGTVGLTTEQVAAFSTPQALKAAIELTEELFLRVSKAMKPGKTEKEVAAFLLNEVDREGVETSWEHELCPSVFTGPESAGAHAGAARCRAAVASAPDRAVHPSRVL